MGHASEFSPHPPAIPSSPRYRAMRDTDLELVLAIERDAYPHPWTPGMFRDCLNAGYYCRVMEVGGRIIGYAVMSMVVDETHTLNLCVAPAWQGQGFGRGLLGHVLELGRRLGAMTAFLEVRASNRAAYHLYLATGFNEVGLRRGYYPTAHGREDAVILAMHLRHENRA